MDISCIISSGDLELYVLGMLSQEDNEKVAQLAALFPEIKREIDDIQQSLIDISNDADVTDVPSPSVRSNLFARLRELHNEEPALKANEVYTNTEEEGYETKVLSMGKQRSGSSFSNFMLAASVIAIIICAVVIARLSNTNNQYQQVARNLQSQLNQTKKKEALQEQEFASSLQLYQSPEFQKINLTHVPGKPDALVQLFWNKEKHTVYAADVSLPQAPAGKQYQLWAIVDGKPISAGMITTKKVPQKMLNFGKADAFAITLEKEGGNPTPQGEMYVLGKTS